MAVYGAWVLDEYRLPRSREPGGGSAGRRHRRVLVAVVALVGHGDGAFGAAAGGEARSGDREALGGAVQR